LDEAKIEAGTATGEAATQRAWEKAHERMRLCGDHSKGAFRSLKDRVITARPGYAEAAGLRRVGEGF